MCIFKIKKKAFKKAFNHSGASIQAFSVISLLFWREQWAFSELYSCCWGNSTFFSLLCWAWLCGHTHTHRMWSVVTEIPGCLTWCYYRNRLTNTLISYNGMTTDLNWLTLIFWLQCNILLGKLDFCPSCEWHFTHTTHPNTAAGILQSDNLVNNCYFF